MTSYQGSSEEEKGQTVACAYCNIYMLALSLLLLTFPTLPAQAEFVVAEPEDGAIYATGAASSKNLSLRYALTGLPGATRLCLELRRGSLYVYRGPVLHRDPEALAHYAKGCFAVGQPVTLQKLVAGNYHLRASAQSDAGVSLANASAVFGVDDGTRADAEAQPAAAARPAELAPTYEWQDVAPGQSVPAGLEIRLSLGEEQRLARIPATWRLQTSLYAGQHFRGFLRTDVRRDTSVADLERQAAEQAAKLTHKAPDDAARQRLCATLTVGSERLAASETVEGAALFQRRGKLRVELEPCGAAPITVGMEASEAVGVGAGGTRASASSSMQLAVVS